MSHETHTAPALAPVRQKRHGVLALRDVPDVEAYVTNTLYETTLPLSDRDLGELVSCGIESVYRVERALPRERPLTPVLDTVLRDRLIDRWHSLHPERAEDAEPARAMVAVAR